MAAGLADGNTVRPYLLSGVSLGGILTKHAFVALAEYAAACKGIVNVVAPHMGSILSTLTKLLGQAKAIKTDRRTSLLKGLGRALQALVELDKRFLQIKGKVPVLSCANGRTTNVVQDSAVSSTLLRCFACRLGMHGCIWCAYAHIAGNDSSYVVSWLHKLYKVSQQC